jgi:DNA polymerase III alpha subunit
LYLRDPLRTIKQAYTETKIELSDILVVDDLPKLIEYIDPKLSVDSFDELNQNLWHMPEEYLSMDIAKWVLDQCKDEIELQRAGEELLLFQDRGMFTLLKYLKYLVDTMRTHNIVWGVGRGSSVASFILFLIGIHRINSLHYDLSIDEFLK